LRGEAGYSTAWKAHAYESSLSDAAPQKKGPQNERRKQGNFANFAGELVPFLQKGKCRDAWKGGIERKKMVRLRLREGSDRENENRIIQRGVWGSRQY